MMLLPVEEPPYVMLAYMRGLFDYLRARNAPVGPVLDVMGLSEKDLRDPDRRVDHALQNAIFDVAERVTGDVNVGLHAGEATHLIHFGLAGQLAMTCRTVRQLIELHSRFQRLLSTGATMRYIESGEEIMGEAGFVAGEEPLSRHTLEYTLASHLTLTRLMSGLPLSVERMEVPYPAPTDCSEQERVFRCPVRYGCAHERLYFPRAVLDVPLSAGDLGSRGALELEARRRLDAIRVRLADENHEIASLKQFVADGLRGGPPSVDDAAASLGMSSRTLQRRLESLSLSYRAVVDSVRRQSAEKYMRDESLSQVDVAFLLGFSDQSAFHRAFRRWFETTPGEYRALVLQRG